MNKQKFKYFIYFFALMLAFPMGCQEDFLEKTPLDQGSVQGFFETEEDVLRAVAGIYDVFQGSVWGGAFYRIHPHFDGLTENAQICCPWEAEYATIARGEHTSTSGGIINDKWDFGYEGIFRANSVLENIGRVEMAEESRTKLIAESRFLRGMIYFDLATLFGDVPLVTEVLTRDEGLEASRSPKSEVIASALADLDFAEQNLDVEPFMGELGRPTKQAAIAVKTRLHLYAGNWAETVANAQKIMDLAAANPDRIGLLDDYEAIFSADNENNKEVLFDIQFVEGTAGEGNYLQVHYAPGPEGNPGNGWGSMTPLPGLTESFYMTDGLSITESPLFDPANKNLNRDPRFYANLFVPGISEWKGGIYTGALGGFSDEYQVRKWVDFDATLGENACSCNETNLILYRYGDIVMMYAEAMNEMNGPTAGVYDAVNSIRTRAGMPDFPAGLSQEEMRDEIRHERHVEFAWEGTRYFDLIRWDIAKDVIPAVASETRQFITPKHNLWPIPQDEIDLNPNLTQNSGY